MDAGGWAIWILIETDPDDADRARHVLAGALCPEECRPDHERVLREIIEAGLAVTDARAEPNPGARRRPDGSQDM